MSPEPDLVDGGVASVERLYDRHARAVFGLAFAFLGDADLAQDVVQEVFVLAWRKRRSLTLVDGSALPWLLASARLIALAMRRKEARRRHDPLPEAELTVVPPDLGVREAVAALAPTDRAVVELVLIEGLSYAQAAERLGLTVSAAGKRLQRARARLRADLRAEGNTP